MVQLKTKKYLTKPETTFPYTWPTSSKTNSRFCKFSYFLNYQTQKAKIIKHVAKKYPIPAQYF